MLRVQVDISEVVPQGPIVRVGRAAASDVLLHHDTISRRQCEIRITGDRVMVTDTDSACGTVIDGTKIHGPTELHEGRSIFFGNFELRVVPR